MRVLLLLLIGCAEVALVAQGQFPFSQYSVTSIFKGAPAKPQLTSETARRFRTVISEGANKGPNFAGHYTVVTWGCGADCASFAIVDALTGKVFDPRFAVSFENTEGQ